MHPACELKLDDLRKTYLLPQPLLRLPKRGGAAAQPKTKKALAGVSLTLGPGLYGLLGPNGAGKSTLIHIITGGLAPDSGQVLWCGAPARGIGFRRVLGYMPQQQGMYDDFSSRAFLRYIAEIKQIPAKQARAQIEQLLEVVNLREVAHKKVGGFSGGMRQRVILAQALLGEPKVLILDEPTAGLDPKERLRLRRYIADLAQDRIVFLTTHIVSDIESIARDVLLMQEGSIVAHGTPEDLMARVGGSSLEDVYMAYLGEE